jgi:5'-3' exonuclease
MKPEVLLIDLGSLYWSAWHSGVDQEVSYARSRCVESVRKLRAGFDLVAVCCDSAKNFRKELDPLYKAHRPPVTSAAYEQLRQAKDTLIRDGMLLWEVLGFEADDVLASACKLAIAHEHTVTICSADKDLTQCVRDGVVWSSPATSEKLDREGVRSKFGVYPELMRDWLAICGDKSDNVRGVNGVGKVGATKLLAEFGSVEGILTASAKGPIATPKVHAAIEDAREALGMGLKLVTLRDDIPIDWKQIYEKRTIEPLTEGGDYDMSEGSGTTEEHDVTDVIGAPPVAASEAMAEVIPAEEKKPQAIERAQTQQLVQAPSWDLSLEPTSLPAALNFAKAIFNSRLYPQYINPEAILAIVIRGREMGMGALTALDAMQMVEGRPTMKAHTIVARAKADPDCEYFKFIGGDDTYAEYETKSRNNPAPTRLKYTMAQAIQAGMAPEKLRKRSEIIGDKDTRNQWEKRPAEMTRKTCAVQLTRIEYPRAALGLYAPFELGEYEE